MKKILMLGEVELTGAEKDLLKQILGIEGELDIEVKPIKTYIPKNIADYAAVLTYQNNPHVLKNMKKRMKKVPLLKYYKNKEGVVTGFMEIKNITIKYNYVVHKLEEDKKETETETEK